jgi:hypothetical protein
MIGLGSPLPHGVGIASLADGSLEKDPTGTVTTTAAAAWVETRL